MEFTLDLGGAVVAVCAVVGLFSLKAFQRQNVWTHRHELAKNLMFAAFKFRNEIRWARFGISDTNLDTISKRYVEALSNLEIATLAGELVWGDRLVNAETKLLVVGMKFWQSFHRVRWIPTKSI